jgi:hypothetical protein
MPNELLLLSKAYMRVSCNAKHGTDKKADKFWDDIALHYVELVGKSNSINEDNIAYFAIEMLLHLWNSFIVTMSLFTSI